MRKTVYSTVLAKIGAERSKFIPKEKLFQLAESKNLIEFATQLRDTDYAEKIAQLPLPLTSRKLERLFRENLIETYIKITRHSPRNVEKFLRSYLLRFEVENIKTLLKTTNAKLSTEQRLGQIYIQVEDFFKHKTAIEEAAKAADLKQLVGALAKTDFAEALNFGLESYEESASIGCFDVLLDKSYYERLHEAFERLPGREKTHVFYYASMENDGFTLLSLLRGKNLRYTNDWLRLAIPRNSFDLRKETVEAMVTAPDFDNALNVAIGTQYGKFFTREQTAEQTIAKAEMAFKKAVFENAKECRILELFNLGALFSFMAQKEAQMHSLVALSLGVEAGAKREDILSQLLT